MARFEISCTIHSYYINRELTESRGRVINRPASYSGGPVFKHQPGDRLY
jgi:hypothetical protein